MSEDAANSTAGNSAVPPSGIRERVIKATRQDWKWPAIFLLAGVAGAVVAFLYFYRAFPEASIDLHLSRTQIAERANAWLRLRGLNTAGYRESVLFVPDDEAKTYLERELGLEAANRLMAGEAPVWGWRVRRFRPPEKQEFRVRLSTSGQLLGFRHIIDEKAPGARLDKQQAQRLAGVFVGAQKGLDLGGYDLVEDSLEARPNRNDYVFTWERKNYKLKEATYRISVTVQGDQVDGYREFLKVPEQWARDYERLRSRNELLEAIATAFYIPLLIAAIFVLVRMAQRKRVAWRAALAIGGVVGLAIAAMGINQLPLMIDSFPTNAPYSTSLAIYLISACLGGALLGVFVALLAASGAPLYSDLLPNRLPLSRLFTFSGLRSKEYFFSTLIGYGMAAFHIGAVVLFYIVARRFGAWAPLEIKYDNALSTTLPWVFPLAISLQAATLEEFSFRLFAIPLLARWLKSRWLAVIIPAFVWGFLHSSYPNQPAWIRGVEVGLIGLLAGWVMLRFGILATLVWHYTVDAVMIGLFLLRSDNLTFRISGALVGDAVLIPLLIGVVLYWQNRGFVETEAAAAEAAAGVSPVPSLQPQVGERAAGAPGPVIGEAGVTAAHEAASPERIRIAVAVGAAGLLLLVAVRPAEFGDFIRFTAGRKQAEQTAVEYLRRSDADPARFRRVTVREAAGGVAPEYVREQVGLKKTNAIFEAGHTRLASWRTRFFRPLEKEEYNIGVAPDGTAPRLRYETDEKAPGASLAPADAQARAEQFLRQQGVKLDDYKLMQSRPEKRPARIDYTYDWEARQALAGEAHERVWVQVIGDRLSGPNYWVKVPEEWERQHTRQRVAPLLAALYVIALFGLAVGLFARRVGQATLRWKTYIAFGVLGALLTLLGAPLDWPGWQAGYNTSVPWSTELTQQLLWKFMGAMGTFAGMLLLAMIADTLVSARFGRVALLPAPGADRARCLREALLLGIGGGLAARGLGHAAGALTSLIPGPRVRLDASAGAGASSLWPAGTELLSTTEACLWFVLLGGAVAGMAFLVLRKPRWIAAGLVLTAAVLAFPGALTPLGYLRGLLGGLILWGSIGGLAWLLRRNAIGYLVAAGVAMLASVLADLARHPALRADAVEMGAVAAAALIAVLLWARRESARLASSSEA